MKNLPVNYDLHGAEGNTVFPNKTLERFLSAQLMVKKRGTTTGLVTDMIIPRRVIEFFSERLRSL